ncbi:MAG: M48 family metallopeptidase [Pseudomonadota bacterium]
MEKQPHVVLSRRALVKGLAAGSVVALAPGCTYNDEIGRSQFLVVSRGQMAQLAGSTWASIRKEERVSRDPRYVTRLQRVSPKIISAAGENPAAWEYAVFDSKDLNAFALPGNKIGVYTGIMDLMANDDELATVVGHEVAHVRFNHSGERYSQAMAGQVGLTVASVGLASSDAKYQREIAAVLGAGVTFGLILPFSRRHELEADKFGVRYMHRAGYDARQSLTFWQKMATKSSGQRPPEFLSTHPSSETRIAQLRREISMLPPKRA